MGRVVKKPRMVPGGCNILKIGGRQHKAEERGTVRERTSTEVVHRNAQIFCSFAWLTVP